MNAAMINAGATDDPCVDLWIVVRCHGKDPFAYSAQLAC